MLIVGKQICHVSTCARVECVAKESCQRTVVSPFKAVASASHAVIAGALAEEISGAIHNYDDQIPLALAIGVLRIVEAELIAEAGEP